MHQRQILYFRQLLPIRHLHLPSHINQLLSPDHLHFPVLEWRRTDWSYISDRDWSLRRSHRKFPVVSVYLSRPSNLSARLYSLFRRTRMWTDLLFYYQQYWFLYQQILLSMPLYYTHLLTRSDLLSLLLHYRSCRRLNSSLIQCAEQAEAVLHF